MPPHVPSAELSRGSGLGPRTEVLSPCEPLSQRGGSGARGGARQRGAERVHASQLGGSGDSGDTPGSPSRREAIAAFHSQLRWGTVARGRVMADLMELHSELFPVVYNQSFYDSLLADNVASIVVYHQREDGGETMVGLSTARVGTRHSLCGAWCDPPPTAYLITFGVTERCRRMRLGVELFNRTLRLLQQRGCRSLSLHVLVSNDAAISFYLHQGFVVTRHLHDYYLIAGEYRDALHMVRDIPAAEAKGSRGYAALWSCWPCRCCLRVVRAICAALGLPAAPRVPSPAGSPGPAATPPSGELRSRGDRGPAHRPTDPGGASEAALLPAV
eukprot:TRINITY_DN29607_c0_g1_i1.p1 TRINITY_DN29607_c0_g1~~TRINITY_DN29607_c0_g1_i1.p1  ORF type:complete len:383 (+),score=95.31 TRINITY_DN29607_c0_g1_i1:161-1150(+)